MSRNRLRTAASLSNSGTDIYQTDPAPRMASASSPGGVCSLSRHACQPDASAGLLNDRMLADQGLLSRVLVCAALRALPAGSSFASRTLKTSEIVTMRSAFLRLLAAPLRPLVSETRNELSPRILSMSDSATELLA